MTVVVADTSPIRYLAVIDSLHILPALYQRVWVPETVLKELAHPNAPREAQAFTSPLPPWVDVRQVDASHLLGSLDPGEAEAIALAQSLAAEVILIDEREARREATNRGLFTMGTIGILEQAAAKRLIDLPSALGKLGRTNFRIDPRYIDDALRRAADQREADPHPVRRPGRQR